MSVSFISELDYDARHDKITISFGDEDLADAVVPVDVNRTHPSYPVLKDFLEVQGLVDDSWLTQKTVSDTLPAGCLGVLPDGTPHPASLEVFTALSLFGERYSGVTNFVRNLIWVTVKQDPDTPVLVWSTDDSVYGVRSFLKTKHIATPYDLADQDFFKFWESTVDVESGLFILDLRGQQVTDETDSQIKELFTELAGYPDLKVVLIGDSLSTVNPTLFKDFVDFEGVFGTVPESSVKISGELDIIQTDNPNGVMWFRYVNDTDSFTAWERVKTPLLSRNATW